MARGFLVGTVIRYELKLGVPYELLEAMQRGFELKIG
jgi:hypothetical protein